MAEIDENDEEEIREDEHDTTWMDEKSEPDVKITAYDITASSNDFNVMTICSYLERGAIIIPPYQRNYVWDKKRASKLIESLALGLPVPQIFLYDDGDGKFSVLDGQQRLLSLYFFTKNRFPRKTRRADLREIFAAKGVFPPDVLAGNEYFENFKIYLPGADGESASALHGKTYDTLEEYQTQFDLRPVRCVVIKQTKPDDDNSSIYEIFDRLNTGGMNLKPQEIRSNLYFSPFYQAVYDLNKLPSWRRLVGSEDRDPHLRDVELILRSFAMLTFSDKYRPSMTRFLNRFSEYAKRHFTEADVDFLKKVFTHYLEAANEVDPAYFQRTSDRLSVGLFESVFYGLCRGMWDKRELTPLKKLNADELRSFSELVGDTLQKATSSTDNIQKRLSDAKALFGSP